MIKNIILDIGGVLFDDSDKNLSKILNKSEKNIKEISKIAFGGNFKKCLLGEYTVLNYMKDIENMDLDNNMKNDILYVLNPKFYNVTFPRKQEIFDYIDKIKKEGYKVYLLSNITKVAFEYINENIKLDDFVDGGIYSFVENKRKPDKEIYELLINRYNLKKEECLFFDDKKINVDSANEIGIKSYIFNSIDDIKCRVI